MMLLFKIFLICSFDSPPVWLSGTISAILKEGMMGNIHVMLHVIWTSGSKEMSFKDIFLPRALAVHLFSRPEPFVQFW